MAERGDPASGVLPPRDVGIQASRGTQQIEKLATGIPEASTAVLSFPTRTDRPNGSSATRCASAIPTSMKADGITCLGEWWGAAEAARLAPVQRERTDVG
jgi:hypothetical protein